MPIATASLGFPVSPLFASLPLVASLPLNVFRRVGLPFQMAHNEFFIALPYLFKGKRHTYIFLSLILQDNVKQTHEAM